MTTDPGTPTPDVLAVERFRTIASDAIGETGYDAYGHGEEADPDIAASKILSQFPSAQFVRDVNSAGVAVRRLVMYGEWEVDTTSITY